ncbi:MAG: hypothetical protein ACTSQ8_23395, partial [Candidatus Helarchaeota archaeon]
HGLQPENLAQAIKTWLDLSAHDNTPSSEGIPWLTWKESSNQLMEAALHSNWYLTWENKQPEK